MSDFQEEKDKNKLNDESSLSLNGWRVVIKWWIYHSTPEKLDHEGIVYFNR